MCHLITFVIDSFVVLFVFSIFVVLWLLTLIIIIFFFGIWKLNVFHYVMDFCYSSFLDGYWFVLATLFVGILVIRLLLLCYFGSYLGFICFDLIKVIGSQWYWCYYCQGNDTIIYSNLLLESDFYIGDLRLLNCNNLLVLLSLCGYKFWVSSIDVIHSYTISTLGLKVDCIPGRCNECVLFSFGSGCFYGQCSELCGVLHGFMPISILFI